LLACVRNIDGVDGESCERLREKGRERESWERGREEKGRGGQGTTGK
jgi:hypothetical protein